MFVRLKCVRCFQNKLWFTNMPFFSLLLPYRNRDLLRLERCLASLRAQSFEDFELVLVDYGSEKNLAVQVAELCRAYPFVSLIYNDSEGRFWNRSHALNTGLRAAKADFIVTLDVDMIYAPHFLRVLQQHVKPRTLLFYGCYYLPENFTAYAQLHEQDWAHLRQSDAAALGIFTVPRSDIHAIGGFDEYFRVWGVEDLDMRTRLVAAGLQNERLPLEKAPVFHQWHPASDVRDNMPTDWKQKMLDYYHAKTFPKDINNPYPQWGEIYQARPALSFKDAKPNYQPQFPLEASLMEWTKRWSDLKTGEYLFLKQEIALFETKNSKLGPYMAKANKLLAKAKISYRLTDLETNRRGQALSFYEVRDAMFYFAHYYQEQILDYYWEQKDNFLCFLAVKA
ncbi:MAG: glycosyltransferase [Cytophagales bacterium]|nr:MAG: glycosyltransferase [Cytophagales bacterium]TAF61309.1 MAG: glycosyltransferase [Cytophagales bacterium]